MAYELNQDSGIEYDKSIDTIRWGSYTINPTELGLKREKAVIDPAKVKSIEDVYAMLGADPKAVKQANAWQSWQGSIFGQQKPKIFTGKDSWKQSAADSIWAMINPAKPSRAQAMYGGAGSPITQLDSRDKNFTKTLDGLLGREQPSIGSTRTGNTILDMANAMNKPKSTSYSRVTKASDGMIVFESGDEIPKDKAFSDKVYNYVNNNLAGGDGRNAPKKPQYSLLV